tara:strand:+ start:2146 stop:3453 length:1308 start_codon:yes stop_codon:yes gene_type:complete
LINNDNSRLHAYNIVLKHESKGLQLKLVRQEYFIKNKLSPNERNRSMALSNEVVRWKRSLDEWISKSLNKPINKLPLNVLCILRLGYYEYVMDDFVPPHAAVDSWVELSKKLNNKKISGLINAVLRKAKYIDKNTINNLKNLGSRFSFQDWMVESWLKKYGRSQTIDLCRHLNHKHEIDMRLDTSSEEIKKLLKDKKIEWSFSPFSKNYIRIKSGLRNILFSNIYSNGHIFVQDRAAGAVVEALDPLPGDIVLDVCAAPGTKSIYIYEKMKGEGKLFSYDFNQSKIDNAIKQTKQLGMDIKWKRMDASLDSYPMADKILIDAPCSGTGVIARKPDIKWRRNSSDIVKFALIQNKIINNVSRFLKKGGVIVYATCSLEDQENWNVVRSFLKLNPDFKLESVERKIPDQWLNSNKCLETFPPRDNVDGMFAAKIKKC